VPLRGCWLDHGFVWLLLSREIARMVTHCRSFGQVLFAAALQRKSRREGVGATKLPADPTRADR